MCYSLRTSIISYSLGIISAIFALFTRQYVLGCLILAYAQMQLSELMIWYGIDNNNLDWNKKGTTFGKYLLPIHNIAIGFGILLSLYFVSKKPITLKDYIPIITGIVFFISIILIYYRKNNYPDVTYPRKNTCNKCQNPENRLKWPYPHDWYIWSYFISIILLIFWIKPKQSRILFSLMFSILFIVAFLIYPKTVGSVWCWSTSFLAPVIVLINYYLIRNVPSNMILT